jgi:hypothetical protein
MLILYCIDPFYDWLMGCFMVVKDRQQPTKVGSQVGSLLEWVFLLPLPKYRIGSRFR